MPYIIKLKQRKYQMLAPKLNWFEWAQVNPSMICHKLDMVAIGPFSRVDTKIFTFISRNESLSIGYRYFPFYRRYMFQSNFTKDEIHMIFSKFNVFILLRLFGYYLHKCGWTIEAMNVCMHVFPLQLVGTMPKMVKVHICNSWIFSFFKDRLLQTTNKI